MKKFLGTLLALALLMTMFSIPALADDVTTLKVMLWDRGDAPAGGTVAFAGHLQLTGNTVVVDHGCGVRTYLYGLQELYVKQGMDVVRNGEMGEAGTLLTVDVKIGNKSVDPWALFRGAGGLFWNE